MYLFNFSNHILQNKESGTNATKNIEPMDLHHDNKDKSEVFFIEFVLL